MLDTNDLLSAYTMIHLTNKLTTIKPFSPKQGRLGMKPIGAKTKTQEKRKGKKKGRAIKKTKQ
jgi:hypothetical protein